MIEQRHETERLEDILREIEREAVDRWARGRPKMGNVFTFNVAPLQLPHDTEKTNS
jgi:hypothetical protein